MMRRPEVWLRTTEFPFAHTRDSESSAQQRGHDVPQLVVRLCRVRILVTESSSDEAVGVTTLLRLRFRWPQHREKR